MVCGNSHRPGGLHLRHPFTTSRELHLDLRHSEPLTGQVTLEQQYTDSAGRSLRKTKTENVTTMTLGPTARTLLNAYVKEHPGLPLAPLFPGPRSARLNMATFRRERNKARDAAGLPEFHPHDVRPTGLAKVAQMGGRTREVMAGAVTHP